MTEWAGHGPDSLTEHGLMLRLRERLVYVTTYLEDEKATPATEIGNRARRPSDLRNLRDDRWYRITRYKEQPRQRDERGRIYRLVRFYGVRDADITGVDGKAS